MPTPNQPINAFFKSLRTQYPRVHKPLGIVSCLNMLPYFHGLYTAPHDFEDLFMRYPTPQQLNAALARGDIIWGCASAIHALEHESFWEMGLLGVGSEGEILSVYLETQGYSCEQDAIYHLKKSKNVTLLTPGASAQSLWLFEQLIKKINIKNNLLVSKKNIIAEDSQKSFESIISRYVFESPHSTPEIDPIFLLSIGDEALLRRAIFPNAIRIDLGVLWKSLTNLPCLFALWCRSSSANRQNKLALEEKKVTQENFFIREFLLDQLRQWNDFSEEQRNDICKKELKKNLDHPEKTHPENITNSIDIQSYLKKIDFDLSKNPYDMTISEYLKMNTSS